MESSTILLPQSQNKVQCEFQRMKNERNKIPPCSKFCSLFAVSHPGKDHGENKDPGNSEVARKAPLKPGISRLPVLAKSLCPQMPSDFSQSHCRWEEKPLAGKTKKIKTCTRSMPFNLSKPRSSKTTNENLQHRAVLQTRTDSQVVQPANKACLKTSNPCAKTAKQPATLGSNMNSNKGANMSGAKAAETRSQPPGHSEASRTLKTLSHPLFSVPSNALENTASSAQNAMNAEACLDNMNLLSLKDATKTSHASQNMLPNLQGNFYKSSNVSSISNKGETFKLDHGALLSILRNEGVGATVLESVTQQSKAYNYQPQRVSVMKSRQKAGPTPVRFVQFSPDPAALQSIVQNEGLKGGGLLAVTPRSSAHPSGRSMSMYSAQRVTIKKNLAEEFGGPVARKPAETPLQIWTPQRVCTTRRKPMSALKSHLSTHQSLYVGTPGLQSGKPGLRRCQEEVVQRLFDEEEDGQSKEATEKGLKTQGEQQPAQFASKSSSEEEVETSADGNEVKEEMALRLQPFVQAPERESVIFFSTGKKLLRGPRFEQQEDSSDEEQRNVQSAPKGTAELSELTRQIKSSFPGPRRDPTAQKSCVLSSAVTTLRERFPPWEEFLMDEEVAFYTSMSVSGLLPPRHCYGNPVAFTLHFEESTRFVPVCPAKECLAASCTTEERGGLI